MSTDKIDRSKKDAKISSADDLTTKKGDVELSEQELKRVTGGVNIKSIPSSHDDEVPP